MLQWCDCRNFISNLWKWPKAGAGVKLFRTCSHATNRQPSRYCPLPPLNALAQSGMISLVAKSQRTLKNFAPWYIATVQTILYNIMLWELCTTIFIDMLQPILICYVHLTWPFLIKYCHSWKMPNKRHLRSMRYPEGVGQLQYYILTCQLQAGS